MVLFDNTFIKPNYTEAFKLGHYYLLTHHMSHMSYEMKMYSLLGYLITLLQLKILHSVTQSWHRNIQTKIQG